MKITVRVAWLIARATFWFVLLGLWAGPPSTWHYYIVH